MSESSLSAAEEERYEELAELAESGELVVAGRRTYGREATFPATGTGGARLAEEQ